MGFGAWRASRKRESGGPEVQVGGVKDGKGSPEMGRGARKPGEGRLQGRGRPGNGN